MRSRDQSVLVQALLSTPTGIQAINRYISLWQHYPPLCANTLCLARTFRRAPLSPERRFYIPSRFLPSVCLSVCVCDSVSGCSTSCLFLSLPLSFFFSIFHTHLLSLSVFSYLLPFLSRYIFLCIFQFHFLPLSVSSFHPLSPVISLNLSLAFVSFHPLSPIISLYLSHSLSPSLFFLFDLFIFSLSTFYR